MFRPSDMRRLRSVAVALLAAALGLAGCSSSAATPQYLTSGGLVAEVTGFASPGALGPMITQPFARPVTVRITGPEVSRLAWLVTRLQSAAPSELDCHEPAGLMYRIVFGSPSATRSRAVVSGYICSAAVTVTIAGTTSWRRDATCALIRAVRQVLPASAKATQSLGIGCDS